MPRTKAKPAAIKDSQKKSVDGVSWQAQKSAMTRDRILDAAIYSFINLGYTNVTTAKVASEAGVSRGAMLHHFPAKTALIQAAIEYLHSKLLADYTDKVAKIPADLTGPARRRAGVDAYWDHLSGDLFTAYHELSVASRTDPELLEIIQGSVAKFESHVTETNSSLFAEWEGHGERYTLAMDLTKFLMEGMVMGQIANDRKARIERLLDYLMDRLEEIFDEDTDSAISRHAGG